MKAAKAWLAVGILWSGAVLAAPVAVQVDGAVAHPGGHALAVDARLFDLLASARPQASAYLPGTSLLRESERQTQQRLKAGVQHDLGILGEREGAVFAPLQAWVAGLPVTGRIPVNGDLRRLDRKSKDNLPLQAGDRLVVPVRPDTVQVVGAVNAPCAIAFQPLAPLAHYLAQCTSLPGANRDWVWLVQPDGHIQRRPQALWNADGQQVYAAPGATLVVGIDDRRLGKDLTSLNDELALLAATQLLQDPS